MKILVCISRTADTTAKIAFSNNNTKFDETGVQFIMNPYDEWYALVRAMELKEKMGATVHLILVGDQQSEPIIRKGLAYGADDAVRIDSGSADPYFIASQIAGYSQLEHFDLILTGKETIDFNGSAIGGMVAGFLGIPFISLATWFELNGTQVIVRREIEGGTETCRVELPIVISCQKGVAEMRTPSIRGITSARLKPLLVIAPREAPEFTEVVRFELPAAKSGVKLVSADHPEELVRLLHEEARVI
ncbi:MAG TPA: electron transfer flavoprotein subunit beta/FixA family protein [Chitinophagaceae bacterium]|nr:electron transfer flavoprotein subunit beta/FixA family protein [Chitinophagaceae bacterium]